MEKTIDKKKVQKERILKYFIEATVDIIEEEGIDAVTIRKVADRAGYNSATIYNYFDNLEHLLFFAALRFITPYTKNLATYIKGESNALERNFAIWKFFLENSFQLPSIFQLIFFNELGRASSDDIAKYYEIYPQDLSKTEDGILEILLLQDLSERTKIILEYCVDEGFILEKDVEELAEMTILIYKGLLSQALKLNGQYDIDELVHKAMKYVKICYKGFLINPSLIGEIS